MLKCYPVSASLKFEWLVCVCLPVRSYYFLEWKVRNQKHEMQYVMLNIKKRRHSKYQNTLTAKVMFSYKSCSTDSAESYLLVDSTICRNTNTAFVNVQREVSLLLSDCPRFESCISAPTSGRNNTASSRRENMSPPDQELGFSAAVNALSFKVHFCQRCWMQNVVVLLLVHVCFSISLSVQSSSC